MRDSMYPPAAASPSAPLRDRQIAGPVPRHAPGSQSTSVPLCDSPPRGSPDPRNRRGCLIQTSLDAEEMQEQYAELSDRCSDKRNSSGPRWKCRWPDDVRYTCTQSQTVFHSRESAEWTQPEVHNSIRLTASVGNDREPLWSRPSSPSAQSSSDSTDRLPRAPTMFHWSSMPVAAYAPIRHRLQHSEETLPQRRSLRDSLMAHHRRSEPLTPGHTVPARVSTRPQLATPSSGLRLRGSGPGQRSNSCRPGCTGC